MSWGHGDGRSPLSKEKLFLIAAKCLTGREDPSSWDSVQVSPTSALRLEGLG